MGKIKKGILGGFSGKVGNVVGASWKGIDYIRSMPTNMKNPRTKGQMEQRSKFAVVGKFLKAVSPVIKIGFRSQANGQTPYNAAMKYNLQNAVISENDEFKLDFSKVVIARGSILKASSISTTLNTGMIFMNWELPQTELDKGYKAIVVTYNEDKNDCIIEKVSSSLAYDRELPENWNGDQVSIYLLFSNDDGSMVSDSTYCGRFAVDFA